MTALFLEDNHGAFRRYHRICCGGGGGGLANPLAILAPVTSVLGLGGGGGGAAAGGGGPLAAVTGVLGSVLDVPGSVLGGVLDVAGLGGGGAPDLTGFSGGNGTVATRTIVETVNVNTGQIVRRRSMPGSPFMMNSEVNAAKKVFRQSASLRKRLPKVKTKESPITQLKNQLVQKALAGNSGSRDVVVVDK